MLERLAAEHDISIVQTRLLGVLRDREPTMNGLARLLGLEKSSVTGLVDRAERRGLVVRVPSSTDGRAVLVSLTAEGRSLASEVASRFEDEVSTMLAPSADAGPGCALETRQPTARRPRGRSWCRSVREPHRALSLASAEA